jgi:hypothetical protein
MRRCPEYILGMVREYRRGLEIVWDDGSKAWYLVDGGERLFSLEHLDGTPIRNLDGCGGEMVELLRRCDTRRTGRGAVLRRWQGLARRNRSAAARERAEVKEEMRDGARDVMTWRRHGHTPRSGAVFQGVSKR